jgi:hypothetical protein
MTFSWKKIETVLARILNVSTEVAAVAQPLVDIANPGIGSLYNLSVAAAEKAEAAAAEAAEAQPTDAAKVAAVAAAVTPVLAQATAQAGLATHTQDQVNAYAQSVVTGLTALSTTPAA